MMNHSNSPTGQAKTEDSSNSSSQLSDFSSEADLANDHDLPHQADLNPNQPSVGSGRDLQSQHVRRLQNDRLPAQQRSALMLNIQRTLGNRYAQNLMRSLHNAPSGSVQRSNSDGKTPNLNETEEKKKTTQPQPKPVSTTVPILQPVTPTIVTNTDADKPKLIQDWLQTNPFAQANSLEVRNQIMTSKKSQLESQRMTVKGTNALARRKPYSDAIEWLGSELGKSQPQKVVKEKAKVSEDNDIMAQFRKQQEASKAQAEKEQRKRAQKKKQKEQNIAENQERMEKASQQRLLEFKNLQAELPKFKVVFKEATNPEALNVLVEPLQILRDRAQEFMTKDIEAEVTKLLDDIPVRQAELEEQERLEKERLHQEYLNLMRLEEQKIQPGMVELARNIIDSAAIQAMKEIKDSYPDFKRPEGKAGLALGSYVSKKTKQRFYVAAINDMPLPNDATAEAYGLWLKKLQPLLLNACEKAGYAVVHEGVFGGGTDVHEEVSLRNWFSQNAVQDVMPGTRIIMAVNHNTICGSCVIRLSNLEDSVKFFNLEELSPETLSKLKNKTNTKLHIASDMATNPEYKNYTELDAKKHKVKATYNGVDIKGNTATNLTFTIHGNKQMQVEANLASYSALQ